MRVLLPLIAVVPLCVGIAACGNAGTAGSVSGSPPNAAAESSPPPESPGPRHPPGADRDGDRDANDAGAGEPYDHDDASLRDYGHPAGTRVAKAVESVITRYYGAIAANDGASACSLISAALASGFSQASGVAGGNGNGSCSRGLPSSVRQSMERSVAELTAINIFSVRVDGNRAVVFLELSTSEIRLIQMEKEGGGWKLSTLLDVGVT